MPRAGTQRPQTRTSSQFQPSQPNQPRGSQSQRSQRRRHVEEVEDEQDEENEEDEEDIDIDADLRGGYAESDLARRANDLVRLALFNEHKRTPLRRDEITKKVMGSSSRSFNRVFTEAQEILRKTFGMELVELCSRAELDKESNDAGGDDALDEAQRATVVRKRSTVSASKTYILRSILDPAIIEYATQTYAEILEAESADLTVDDDEDEDAPGSRMYGSIIAWNSGDQLGPTGFLYVILALILVSGRVLGDAELRTYLKRLKVPISQGHLRFSAKATHQSMSVDAYLNLLIKQGYIDRRKAGEAKKGKGKGKRGRVMQEEEQGITYEWRWGNRAQSEVGEQGIAQFMADFMVGEDDADDEDEEGSRSSRHRQQQGESKFEKMMKGIQRAAGGELADVK